MIETNNLHFEAIKSPVRGFITSVMMEVFVTWKPFNISFQAVKCSANSRSVLRTNDQKNEQTVSIESNEILDYSQQDSNQIDFVC